MTVGFHSPMPPARTGVADYAAALLKAMRGHGPVKLDADRADIHLYHLGNNQLHRGIYERAIREPGIVVLHDAVMHHFYLGAFDEERYVEEYCFNYGEWEREYARELFRERAGSGMDPRYFAHPMLRRIAERSLGIIVHNAAAARLVREHAPDVAVIEIPHFFDCPFAISSESGRDFRLRLGIEAGAFLFGIFGHLRETKRIIPILDCFRRLHQNYPQTALLIVGEFASRDLARAVEPFADQPGVYRLRYLPDRDFWHAAKAVDCCLNLRWPPAGETSGIGVRLMGLGKPVFFTEGEEITAIPEDACVRITPGVEESAEVFEYMKVVVTLPQVDRGIGERARHHIDRYHSLSGVAAQYWNTLCAFCASSGR